MFKGWFGEKKTQFNLWLSLNTKLFGKRFYREKGMWPVGKRFVLILFGVKTDPRKSGRCGYFGGHDEFVFDNRPCGIVKPVNFPRRYILRRNTSSGPFFFICRASAKSRARFSRGTGISLQKTSANKLCSLHTGLLAYIQAIQPEIGPSEIVGDGQEYI